MDGWVEGEWGSLRPFSPTEDSCGTKLDHLALSETWRAADKTLTLAVTPMASLPLTEQWVLS